MTKQRWRYSIRPGTAATVQSTKLIIDIRDFNTYTRNIYIVAGKLVRQITVCITINRRKKICKSVRNSRSILEFQVITRHL